MKLPLLVTLGAIGFVLVATLTHAKDCGDDLGGVRVACACGDSVVSNTTLRKDDPVVQERCLLDGLRIAARPEAEGLTVNLAGLGFRGTMAGSGIAVVSGGEGGVIIIGGTQEQKGQLTGFNVGLSASRPGTLTRVENLRIVGSRRDGASIRSQGTFLVGVELLRNGGTGLRLSGKGGRVFDLRSTENGGAGILLAADGVIVEGNVAGNKGPGLVDRGRRNDTSKLLGADDKKEP